MADVPEYLVHASDEYDRATRLRVDAGLIVSQAVSGSTVRTTPETLIRWIDMVRAYLETGSH